MKILVSTGALVVMSALLSAGCDAQPVDAPEFPGIETAFPDGPPNGLAIPEESEVWEETIGGKTVVWFRLPEGYALLGREVETGEATLAPGGGVICTCTEGGGGCSPFRASRGGETMVGCIMDPDRCSSCDLSALTLDGPEGSAVLRDLTVLDRERPVKLVETREEAATLRCATSTLMESEAAVEALAAYVRPFQGPDPAYVQNADPDDLEDDVISAPFDVFGHIVWAPILLQITEEEPTGPLALTSELIWDRFATTEADEALAPGGGGGGSYTCESGEGGCTYGRRRIIGVGTAEWCEAGGCNTCTLN